MSNSLFDVVFFGILQPGKDKDTAMQNMAKLFKTEPAKLSPYFAGGRKVIKGKVSAEVADKYKAALENVGLVIKLEEVDTAAQSPEQPPGQTQPQPAATDTASATDDATSPQETADTSGISMAPVGADVIEHPVEVVAQEIDDISDISMAEVGADVLDHPTEVVPQEIDDISDITMAEPGVDVLDQPTKVVPQKIEELPDLTLAEVGADVIENPEPERKANIPDTSELSLSED